ncbi:MAG: GTP-binding protein [Candidatus Poribacteria bacterium]|nr:GTP-binding protein [Candidatus Poribacteria bacterium]
MTDRREIGHNGLPICTLGATGHGKTTLTAAIAKVIAKIGSIRSNVGNQFEQQVPLHHRIREGISITYRSIDYETSGKFYSQIDCETHLDIVKLLVSRTFAIHGAIWVVDAVDGVTQEAEAHLRIANHINIPTIISFLNTRDTAKDDELIDICRQEMRDSLSKCGWEEQNSPIIVGDADRALNYKGDRIGADHWKPIVDLIFAMNRCMPAPVNPESLPPVMPIYEIVEELKERVTVRGEIVQGHLAVGQAVDIVGKGDRIKTKCLSIKENEVTVESEPDWLSVGQVLCPPKTIKAHSEFTALVYLLTQEESGTHIPLIENDKPEVHLWGIDVSARLQLPSELSIVTPGANAHVSFILELPLAMEVGTTFEIKKMGSRIGLGVVTAVV